MSGNMIYLMLFLITTVGFMAIIGGGELLFGKKTLTRCILGSSLIVIGTSTMLILGIWAYQNGL